MFDKTRQSHLLAALMAAEKKIQKLEKTISTYKGHFTKQKNKQPKK